MEKRQLDRRKKIATDIVLALGASAAIYAIKDGRLGHARNYPGGSFIIDVLKDTKEKSIRVSGIIHSLNPLRLEVDSTEHTGLELDEVEDVFADSLASQQ